MGGEKNRKVVVDTYALMAMVFGELSSKAENIMCSIYKGEVTGIVPETVAYEYTIQWYKGRIPALKNIDEVKAFLKTYFIVRKLEFEDYIKAAEIKVMGDKLLAESGDENLMQRRLSLVDSTVLTVALSEKCPILTGDRDLTYVALKLGLHVIC